MEFKNILVPIDFSKYSAPAVAAAVQLARPFRCNITLAHVFIYWPEMFTETQTLTAYHDFFEKKKKDVLKELKKYMIDYSEDDISVNYIVLQSGSAADCLQEYIETHNFDLVVLGKQGQTNRESSGQGSVTESLIRSIKAPVYSVPLMGNPGEIKRVLVPIDFSQYSEYAIEHALFFAREYNARLTLIHVIEQEQYPYHDASAESLCEIDRYLGDMITNNLQQLAAEQDGKEFVDTSIVKEGIAYKEIIAYAKAHSIDLMIIPTHGVTDLEYLLLGSTAEKVIRWTPCPTLSLQLRD